MKLIYLRAVNRLGQLVDELRSNRSGGLGVDGVTESIQAEEVLETIRAIDYGEPEALKKAAVAVLSQIRNVRLTESHVNYLAEAHAVLSDTISPNSEMANRIFRSAKQFGLDPYRGILSSAGALKKYKLVEVSDDV